MRKTYIIGTAVLSILLVPARIDGEVVLQTPCLGDALGVRATRGSPITAIVAGATSARAAMSRVVIVNPGMIADVSTGPSLIGECQANSPAAATIGVLVNRRGVALAFYVT